MTRILIPLIVFNVSLVKISQKSSAKMPHFLAHFYEVIVRTTGQDFEIHAPIHDVIICPKMMSKNFLLN